MTDTTKKLVYRVVDGVRQSFPTPWGALQKGDHIMLWIPDEVDGWWETNPVGNNVFILDADSFLHVEKAVDVPDDPEDVVKTYAVWTCHTTESYLYSGAQIKRQEAGNE